MRIFPVHLAAISTALMVIVCWPAASHAQSMSGAAIRSDERRPNRPPRPPPPASGSNTVFSFQRSATYEGMYEVLPHGETEATLVSANFLSLVGSNPAIADEQKLVVLTSYPEMVVSQFNMLMNQNYPDASADYAQPFETLTVTATPPGTGHATISQDPSLPAYVRVQMVDTNGVPLEFGISRPGIAQLLTNPNLKDNPDTMLIALQQFPFRLPDEARTRFNSLGKAELFELAGRTPLLARQEFVKSRDVFIKDAEAAGRTNVVERPSWMPQAMARAQAVAQRGRAPGVLGQPPGMPPPMGSSARVATAPVAAPPVPPAAAKPSRGSLIFGVLLVVGGAAAVGFLAGRRRNGRHEGTGGRQP